MTDLLVERLRIACRAGHDREREALALRTRLERIARSRLPEALDRALPASGKETFGRIGVRLDLDPSDYDDETIALLWAERIRRAVARDSLLPPGGASSAEAGGDPALPPDAASTPPSAGLVFALLDRALAGDSSALDELAAILDSGRGRDELERLSSSERRLLAEQLERYARRLEAAVAAAPEPSAPRTPDDGESTPADGAARDHEIRVLRTVERATALREAARALRHRDRPAKGRRGPRRAGHDPTAGLRSSSVAGIVLLYPWLGRFLSDAAEAQPDLASVPVRRLALARLTPDVAAADCDPLVRFLAGDDLDREDSPLAQPPDTSALDERADTVLRSFSKVLPGFESSSSEFVRREFLLREGTLATDTDPTQLVVGALPFDPVLVRLPYPIGLVRLPWTPPLSVRIER